MNLQGVILDWAGTTVDYGCMAPTKVFVDVFAALGVPITLAEARGPMGLYKRDHIREVAQLPAVAARWRAKYARPPDENDVQSMYDAFIPLQMASIVAHADVIPGVVEAIAAMRTRGLKIGSTTGYTRAMMEVLIPEAAKHGYSPDCVVCPDDVPAGRPAPWMCFQNAMQLNIYPMRTLVKIGDTLVDIAEGLNAGMWTIGVALTGNELGLTASEVAALPATERELRLRTIRARFTKAGAHYVVRSLADVLPVLNSIESRLARGEKP